MKRFLSITLPIILIILMLCAIRFHFFKDSCAVTIPQKKQVESVNDATEETASINYSLETSTDTTEQGETEVHGNQNAEEGELENLLNKINQQEETDDQIVNP